MQLSFLSPFYLWRCSHEKNTRLSTPTQLQYLRSRVWEPGNEAIHAQCIIKVYTENTSKYSKPGTEGLDLKVPQFFKSLLTWDTVQIHLLFLMLQKKVCAEREREISHISVNKDLNFTQLQCSLVPRLPGLAGRAWERG